MREAGIAFLVVPVSEELARFHAAGIQQLIQQARALGLEVWLDPWAWGGIFGGEAHSRVILKLPRQRDIAGVELPAACPSAEQTARELHAFLRELTHWGADGIFLDEPHFYLQTPYPERRPVEACFCEACEATAQALWGASLAELPREARMTLQGFQLARLLRKATKELDGRWTLCVLPPELGGNPLFPEFAALFREMGWQIAVDPYFHLVQEEPLSFVERWVEFLLRADPGGWLWVPGFLLRERDLPVLENVLALAEKRGLRRVAFWSFRGTQAHARLSTAASRKAWQIFARAFLK